MNRRSIKRPAPRRARRYEARRRDILRVAARIFRERGVAETGMRDIAEAADLSAANLYHYFRGKDEILFYCQDRTLDRLLASAAAARRTGREAGTRLASVLAAHARTLLDDVEGATAHLEVGALPPLLRDRIVRKRDRYERAVRQLVTAGVTSGAFIRVDPAIVTRAMLGALNWTVTWFRPEGATTGAQVGTAIATFLVRGISA
ncbi:MAG: TetR/AcrR family transcriptional regulator [Vicinamibacterales bacterium]